MASITQIPRHLMPQIPKNKINEFCSYLKENNVSTSIVKKSLDWIKPIQQHVNQEKVDNFVKNEKSIDESPIIVTSEGYLVDGHHRWVAAKKLNHPDMNCLVCDCPLREFLKLAHDFDHTYVKSVHELTTYGRLGLEPRYEMIRLTQLLSEGTKVSREQSDRLFQAIGLQKTKVSPEEFFAGLNEEMEHIDLTHGDLKKTALLVLAHLKKVPDYYSKLQKYVEPDKNEYASDCADDDVPPVTGMMNSSRNLK